MWRMIVDAWVPLDLEGDGLGTLMHAPLMHMGAGNGTPTRNSHRLYIAKLGVENPQDGCVLIPLLIWELQSMGFN